MSHDTAERPKHVKTFVSHCMKNGRPVFITGSPGVGKSDLIEQIAKEQGRRVIDMRLLLLDPTDLKGIPFFDPEMKTMRWAQPSDLPSTITERDFERAKADIAFKEATLKKEKAGTEAYAVAQYAVEDAQEYLKKLELINDFSKAILFLDEMNAAPQSVQAAAYQLILNRRVGEYRLPDGISIVCAGNKDSDKGVTFRMPSPLANRLVHIEMTANFEDWQEWAINNGEHPDVIGFLSHMKHYLFKFDPRSPDKAFATPRSWHFVSQLLDDSLPDSMNTSLVAGCVGSGLAGEFAQHRKIASKMPKPEDILTGKEKKLNVKELSAMYSLTVSLCYTLKEWHGKALAKEDGMDETKWHEAFDNFLDYMMKNFATELTVLGAKVALRDFKLPVQHRKLKNFGAFHSAFGKYILED